MRSGEWLKIEKSTPDKPEVIAIAEEMGVHPDEAFGRCFRVWRWFDEHTQNGHAPSVTKKALDCAIGVVGLCDALEKVGWLEGRNGEMYLPNFDRHNGQTGKQRALARQRQAAKRVTQTSRSKRDTFGTPSSSLYTNRSTSTNTFKYSEDFESFWKIYPRSGRVKKQAAWRAYRAQLKLGRTDDEIIEAAQKYAQSAKGRGEYAGYAATFLNSMLDDDPDDWNLEAKKAKPQVAKI